jgi:hypothetical protein
MVLHEIVLQPNLIFLNTSPHDRGYYPPRRDPRTNTERDGNVGITIPLSGQHVQKLGNYNYLLQPSGTEIMIWEDSVQILLPGGIKIREGFFSGYGDLSNEEMEQQLDSLDSFLTKESIKQVGRQVGLVKQLEMPNVLNRAPGNNKSRTLRRNVPYGAKGVISSFLTGKTGSINSQTNKLQQNLGTSLAPRPRKRHTRRRR